MRRDQNVRGGRVVLDVATRNSCSERYTFGRDRESSVLLIV